MTSEAEELEGVIWDWLVGVVVVGVLVVVGFLAVGLYLLIGWVGLLSIPGLIVGPWGIGKLIRRILGEASR